MKKVMMLISRKKEQQKNIYKNFEQWFVVGI